MIYVILLPARKNLVHDNWETKCDVPVYQTPHIFSDSPGSSIHCCCTKGSCLGPVKGSKENL